jgi:hypothetical protein
MTTLSAMNVLTVIITGNASFKAAAHAGATKLEIVNSAKIMDHGLKIQFAGRVEILPNVES